MDWREWENEGKGGAWTFAVSKNLPKKMLHNYAAAPWQPSHSHLKCAVMEPSGDLINVLIEVKEHLFTVSEHKVHRHNKCADMWVIIW